MFALILLGDKAPAAAAGLDVQQPDTSHLFARTLTAIALFGLPILVFAKVSARFDTEIARIREDEWRAFDRKKEAWKTSFFCHRCQAVFNPAPARRESIARSRGSPAGSADAVAKQPGTALWAGERFNSLLLAPKSGRRGSNPRQVAWEATTLPLSYSRVECPI